MVDLCCVKEIKVIQSGIGYKAEIIDDATAEVNDLLSEGWKLITIVTDSKFSTQFKCVITNTFYIFGKIV